MADAATIARMLADRVQALAAELLPDGSKQGAEWVAPSRWGGSARSLSVHLVGAKAGIWKDFATGDKRGDALDLVAELVTNGDKARAIRWARAWLGVEAGGPQEAHAAARQAQLAKAEGARRDAEERERRRRAAVRMFLSAVPNLAGTPAALYLAARGIDFAELGRQPRSLRFAPALLNTESGREWPALVAAITDAAGTHVATHRTWLAEDRRGVWRKAPVRYPKMSLGPVTGGTVRLWRGASGKPLAQAPEGETVAIAEGIETALSVAIACPELRVLSSVSVANMPNVVLPAAVRTVIICADNDRPDSAAARALEQAVAHFASDGRVVRVARSPIGKDFNDAIMQDLT